MKDVKSLDLPVKMEPYGLFTQYHSIEGLAAWDNLTDKERKLQGIIPDLFMNGQMWELKSIQAVNSFARQTGNKQGANIYYKDNSSKNATKIRENMIPAGYELKARKADNKYGGNICQGLRDMQTVIGLVVGAFGEMSANIDQFILNIADDGAINKFEEFGQKSILAAKGIIAWWLKRRWSRISLISTVQMKYDALRYVGGAAQAQAARIHRANGFRSNYADEIGRNARERDIRHFL